MINFVSEGVALQGEVSQCNSSCYEIQLDEGPVWARCALSCSLVPELRDQVVVLRVQEQWVILAILHRPSEAPLRMNFQRDVEITLPQRKLTLRSEALDVQVRSTLSIFSTVAEWIAQRGEWSLSELSLRGKSLKLTYTCMEAVHQVYQAFIHRSVQMLSHSFRKVKGTDILEAENAVTKVNQVQQVQANMSVYRAEQDMKIDGKRVHLG